MTRRSNWVVVAALLLAVMVAPFVITVEPPAPPEGWHVNVRWGPSVNEAVRREAEAQYSLKLLDQNSERTFIYRLGDTSRANIRALVEDTRVEDTHGIDRAALSVPAPRVTLARRYLDEHEDLAEQLGPVGSWANVAVLVVALLAWSASRNPRVLEFLTRGIPPLSSDALGIYRFALGVALAAVVIKYNDLPDTPFPRELHRGHDWFANWEWVHALASRPDITSWITPISVALLLAFALGAFARFTYIAFLVLLSVHVLVVLQHKSAHDWGLPLVTLWGLAVVPWSEGVGIDRSRRASRPERDFGFAVWFPGLMIGLAFLAAAFAKLDSSGIEWVTGGAVKYHFIEDSRQAPATWGLWVAANHPVAVAMSAAAILIEATFIIHVFSRNLWVRAAFGLAGLALLVGFRLLQGVVWTQWWVLFLCFVPWQVIAERLSRRTEARVAARRMVSPLGREAVAVTMLMIVVQVFASAHRFEAEPFVSDYGMYSWTWPSRDAFDRQMARKYRRYRYREWIGGRAGEDISEALSALPKAMDVLADATDRLREGEELGDAQRHALSALASAYRETYGRSLDAVAVQVSEQAFDWRSGRFRLTAGNERVGVLDLTAGRLIASELSRVAGRY